MIWKGGLSLSLLIILYIHEVVQQVVLVVLVAAKLVLQRNGSKYWM